MPVSKGAALEYTERILGGPMLENESVISVSTSAIQLAANNGDRVGLILINLGAGNVFIGVSAGVSANQGVLLGANGGSATLNVTEDFTLTARQWWAICPAGGPSNVYVLEYSRFALTPQQGGA